MRCQVVKELQDSLHDMVEQAHIGTKPEISKSYSSGAATSMSVSSDERGAAVDAGSSSHVSGPASLPSEHPSVPPWPKRRMCVWGNTVCSKLLQRCPLLAVKFDLNGVVTREMVHVQGNPSPNTWLVTWLVFIQDDSLERQPPAPGLLYAQDVVHVERNWLPPCGCPWRMMPETCKYYVQSFCAKRGLESWSDNQAGFFGAPKDRYLGSAITREQRELDANMPFADAEKTGSGSAREGGITNLSRPLCSRLRRTLAAFVLCSALVAVASVVWQDMLQTLHTLLPLDRLKLEPQLASKHTGDNPMWHRTYLGAALPGHGSQMVPL